jgi:non-homologous end joining protein Ku
MVDIISNIVGGVGSAIQGVGQMQQSKVDDVCGKKPGIFAKKEVKDQYQQCIMNSADAKMELMKQQSEMAKRSEATKESKKTGLYVAIGVSVLIAVVIIVVIIRKRKK